MPSQASAWKLNWFIDIIIDTIGRLLALLLLCNLEESCIPELLSNVCNGPDNGNKRHKQAYEAQKLQGHPLGLPSREFGLGHIHHHGIVYCQWPEPQGTKQANNCIEEWKHQCHHCCKNHKGRSQEKLA